MLRDMTDSRRIDQLIQLQNLVRVFHHGLLLLEYRILECHAPDHHLSPFLARIGNDQHNYAWPIPEVSSILHVGSSMNVSRLQERYAKEFSILKPDKHLRWLPHLGRVHLEIELDDRVVEADVPPLEAAFIELFSEKGSSRVTFLHR